MNCVFPECGPKFLHANFMVFNLLIILHIQIGNCCTDRGRTNSRELTSTACTSVSGADLGSSSDSDGASDLAWVAVIEAAEGLCNCNCSTIRSASNAAAFGKSMSTKQAWPAISSTMRMHKAGQSDWSTEKYRPRFNSVICFTLPARRSERTRR